MLIVGLTGGVASGKTTVSKVFEEEGAYLIDTDQIARELVQPCSPAYHEIIKVFGKEILEEDGTLHRKRLASRIFSDPDQRRSLNRILHPRIKEEMDRRIKGISKRAPEMIVVVDAPLLVETGIHRKMDKVVVITSREDQQIKRLRAREGLSPEEARKIISSQMALEEKVKIADFVIQNEGSLGEAIRQTRKVFQELKKTAQQKKGPKQ
jgi:dephospho-CoA kinase